MNGRANSRWWLGLLGVLVCPSAAYAQAAGQVWNSFYFVWLESDRLTYEVLIEPKTQPFVQDNEATFTSVDATPKVEYTLAKWVDVLGEVDIGYKNQSDDVNTTTVTPRVGVQLHIFSRIMRAHAAKGADREKPPNKRVNLSTLVRLANENTYFDTDDPSKKSEWQLRSRTELGYPLNRPKTTSDGAVYLQSDGELFFPIDREVVGGIVSQIRIRTGVGYRRSFAWRFEALYVWIGERKSDGAMAPQSHAIDVIIRRQF